MSAAPFIRPDAPGPLAGVGAVRVVWDVAHALHPADDPTRDPPPARLVWRLWRQGEAWLAMPELHAADSIRPLADAPLVARHTSDEPSGIHELAVGQGHDLTLCFRGDRLVFAHSGWLARLDPRGGRIDRPSLTLG